MTSESNHLDKIRDRFTATVDVFAASVRNTRMAEAQRLAERATEGLANVKELLAVDVACGPGTFTRPLAARVRHAIGTDLTPAMIEKARAEAARDGITNIEFVQADVYALPFTDGVAGVASCGYAFHHMTDPADALGEMTRVLHPGGCIAITDIVVPEGSDAELQDGAERMRDPSHTNTLSVAQFRALIRSEGLQIRSEALHDNWHNFDHWMKNAGSAPGDSTYAKTREMMERLIGDSLPGFQVRRSEKISGDLEFMHTVLLVVAEKPVAGDGAGSSSTRDGGKL